MNYNNSDNSISPFFEGWYFKHSGQENIISFIVGRNIEINGAGSAFIQVITENESYNTNYPLDTFKNFEKKFIIKVGDSYFSEKGIYVNIDTDELQIKGKIFFSKLTPLKYSLMGPLKFIPNLQCKHEVISMHHMVFGKLNFNSQILNFDNGIGYIESDSGHSFPQNYTWVQCNNFEKTNASIMVAVAKISLFKKNINGTACIINYQEKEYRLATYFGAKVDFCNNYCIIVKQRKYKLVIRLYDSDGQKLLAPNNGSMSRIIYESIRSKVKVWFYKDEELIFYGNSEDCSFEIVK